MCDLVSQLNHKLNTASLDGIKLTKNGYAVIFKMKCKCEICRQEVEWVKKIIIDDEVYDICGDCWEGLRVRCWEKA
jgi:hypothetical protein